MYLAVLTNIKGKLVIQNKTDISRTSWQYAVEINSMLDIYNIDKSSLDGCIIASVVPPLTSVMKRQLTLQLGLSLWWLVRV